MTPLLTTDRLAAICRLAGRVQGVPGAVAEVGVYRGGTLALLAELFPDRKVYGFDTFAGLPAEQWEADEWHKPGEFAAALAEVKRVVAPYGMRMHLVPGVFPASAAHLDGMRFAFVHLDVDLRQATRQALRWLLPRLSPGGIVVVDDYGYEHCPGVRQACEEMAPGRWVVTPESRREQPSAYLVSGG